MQLIINIILSFVFYFLIAYSFGLIYSVVKFFNLAHAAYITISAYLTYSLVNQAGLHILMAMLLAIGITIGIGILLEQYLFGPIKRKNAAPMSLMIISLGTYIALQNCISLIWGDLSLSIRFSSIQAGYNIFGGHITLIQIISIFILLGMFLVTNIIIYHCKTGRNIRAVSDNPELSNIMGINSEKTTLWVCGISSFLAAIVGILYALDTDMTPVMGFNLLLYGVVAMIIGGTGNSRGLVGGSLLLSAAQHLAAYFIGSQWMNAIAYIFLILFLLYRPLGFSGIRLKKTEL
ncbi:MULTISPECIES: branched-chain amino acid ABC transporter permease [Bacteroides]|uniref:branched-chain amino acid ABC transporter permease n=1 Tax=Bacteroides TaxID=816 RepID=UPI00189EBE26|nr:MULTISPECIES: branched-chain amino acid ABC transporter permease [Bacteroides]MDC1767426.1 branched-chain amino acid ABC transporter permease [Bacteroides uniformis]MDC1771051.1 branched-chain amino acid ABC transporter permease [Bacteroides uniformis]MDC1777288.1 branched-chain amino acid ABC transporter permease [Bacteroides uniformis]MDC1778813.1 branched-chain amino acid ABC transporter permease [Bacteroides uniformis]